MTDNPLPYFLVECRADLIELGRATWSTVGQRLVVVRLYETFEVRAASTCDRLIRLVLDIVARLT
jgi:hypothetical protein